MLWVSLAPGCVWAASDAAVEGVVRDAHGAPQGGALVELLGPNASVIARALTDGKGRYLLSGVLPGEYRLRASAALLLPAVQGHLHLRSGMHAVADLTITAVFAAGSWLPTETHSAKEPDDDWRWALRATANRPLLRLNEDDPDTKSAASSAGQEPEQNTRVHGEVAFSAGNAQFGEGRTQETVSLGRTEPGAVSMLRTSLGEGHSANAGRHLTVAASTERTRLGDGTARFYLGFASRPELQAGAGEGLTIVQLATTETLAFGDTVIVDAGTLLTAEHLVDQRLSSAPYLRVAFRPSPGLVLEYRLATSRTLQASEDLRDVVLPETLRSDPQGHPLLDRDLHQEIRAALTGKNNVLAVALYRDSVSQDTLEAEGSGAAKEFSGLPVIVDPSSDVVRLAVPGYETVGGRVTLTRTVTHAASACIEGDMGRALALPPGPAKLQAVPRSFHPVVAGAVEGSLKVHGDRTGTRLQVGYRWQPGQLLSQVDEFDVPFGDAFLGLKVKQRLWAGHRLQGVNAVLVASNLLAQGYRPVLGPDGHTLYLTPVPRTLQAGLAFSF